jgi:hypothetical protein
MDCPWGSNPYTLYLLEEAFEVKNMGYSPQTCKDLQIHTDIEAVPPNVDIMLWISNM